MVITRNGEVYYMTDNNPRGVDCSYLDGKLKDSYNIHTHPPDTTQYSFSLDADIPAALQMEPESWKRLITNTGIAL